MALNKAYTPLTLDELPVVRDTVNRFFKTNAVGEYFTRTFYIGPRPKPRHSYASRPASTTLANANYAKIAVYKVTGRSRDYSYKTHSCSGRFRRHGVLVGYVKFRVDGSLSVPVGNGLAFKIKA